MQEKLSQIEKRYAELEQLLADAETIKNKNLYQQYAKELSEISGLVRKYREFKKNKKDREELLKILDDSKTDQEFLQLARQEFSHLEQKAEELAKDLENLLNKSAEDKEERLIVEIRAGTGGQEASLFAQDLYRMYTKFAANKAWKAESISGHTTDLGGFKEIIFSITGKGAYQKLKTESGVHRVQRVPATEAQGRIHTSTATVAVLKEPEEIEIKIDSRDLRIDVFRSSGPGGQSVNTTDSAVRVTHLPTGMVVTCQDERSQLKNKNKAMRVLRARLLDNRMKEKEAEVSQERKSQIGSGERSEKIRTYNFPDRRVTDHRIGLTLHKLEAILEGDLDDFIDAILKNQNNNLKK